jgi:hypothetical protein
MANAEHVAIPLTSACEQTGRSGRRLNNDPGPEGPSDLPGAQVARHEARRIAWTPEAKQISDRICVAGSRATYLPPWSGAPLKVTTVPAGMSWVWMLAFGRHEDRWPTFTRRRARPRWRRSRRVCGENKISPTAVQARHQP